jgi:hypothetical protein
MLRRFYWNTYNFSVSFAIKKGDTRQIKKKHHEQEKTSNSNPIIRREK